MTDWMGFDAPETRSRTFAAAMFIGCVAAAVIVVGSFFVAWLFGGGA